MLRPLDIQVGMGLWRDAIPFTLACNICSKRNKTEEDFNLLSFERRKEFMYQTKNHHYHIYSRLIYLLDVAPCHYFVEGDKSG